jgi:hypothetical protein
MKKKVFAFVLILAAFVAITSGCAARNGLQGKYRYAWRGY